MTGVAGVVLAAGAGTRFGGPKALARLDGERLVDRAVATLRHGGCSDVLVVQGAEPLDDVDGAVVDNALWHTGMGSSLRVALRNLASSDADAAVILLVDTPWVGSAAVARLLGALAGAGATGAAPSGPLAAQATYGGLPGHPVLLARAVWDDVAASAVGDRGARAWLRDHRELVLDVPCDGTGDPRDVDRPADLLEGPPRT
jgi:CTP:molybdopterin cytidylyltransferase MocA